MTNSPVKHGILLLHAWWGRNAVIDELARRFEREGFVVEAPDLYHGALASTIEEAQALARGLDSDGAFAEIQQALDTLRARPEVTGRVAVVAFSLGVWFALWLSDERTDDVDAVVVFYGTYDGGVEKMTAPILANLASDDEFEPMEMVEAMRTHFEASAAPLEVNIYPGTKHWFFEPDRPEFDAPAAAKAWDRTLGFLRETLD